MDLLPFIKEINAFIGFSFVVHIFSSSMKKIYVQQKTGDGIEKILNIKDMSYYIFMLDIHSQHRLYLLRVNKNSTCIFHSTLQKKN